MGNLDSEIHRPDEQSVVQRPFCVGTSEIVAEGEVKATYKLGDQFRHFQERDVFADTGTGAHAELVFPRM